MKSLLLLFLLAGTLWGQTGNVLAPHDRKGVYIVCDKGFDFNGARAGYCEEEPKPAPKSEAVDVPAIWSCKGGPKFVCLEMAKVWTCANQHRVLLTSEDGVKHCVKFSQVLQ